MSTKTKTVCFYTLGPDFTRLVRGLWQEDKPHLALHCLMDGNASVPFEVVIGVLTGTHMLVGDSRDKDGMSIVADPEGNRFPSVEETHQRLINSYISAYQEYFMRLRRAMRPLRHRKDWTPAELRESGEHQREVVNTMHAHLTDFCKLTGIKEIVPLIPALTDADYRDDSEEPEGIIEENRESFAIDRGIKRAARPDPLRNASPSQRASLGLDDEDNQMSKLAETIGVDAEFLSLDRYIKQAQQEPYSLATVALLDTKYDSGYINRDGMLYPCGDRYHSTFGPVLCEHLGVTNEEERYDSDTMLLRAGLVKFSMRRFMYYPSFHNPALESMSPAQVEAITAWADARQGSRINYNTQMQTTEEFLTAIRPE